MNENWTVEAVDRHILRKYFPKAMQFLTLCHGGEDDSMIHWKLMGKSGRKLFLSWGTATGSEVVTKAGLSTHGWQAQHGRFGM